ncbi:hypothetical protein TNIN_151371 [Trichonephila inaurata madagascariensis]|uniref:Uncharacterized protein n=1 Tax=Trichonephila inaurata madagascariensis TaxID=2747483 RepID=A0A8X6YE31_9ARAC|nr:hypothetical protein TNIN_151371 [Trichonephila inaurata madagascariensis]
MMMSLNEFACVVGCDFHYLKFMVLMLSAYGNKEDICNSSIQILVGVVGGLDLPLSAGEDAERVNVLSEYQVTRAGDVFSDFLVLLLV